MNLVLIRRDKSILRAKMQEFALLQAISFHAIIGYLLFIIAFVNEITLFFIKDFVKINKLSFALTPLFLGLLFIAFLSGVSVWAMKGFEFSIKILLMIIANCMFVFEILRVKKLRIARANLTFRKSYIRFAKITNAIYLAIMLLVFLSAIYL